MHSQTPQNLEKLINKPLKPNVQYKHHVSDIWLLISELLVQQLASQRLSFPVPLFDLHHSHFSMLLDTIKKKKPNPNPTL